MMYNTLYLLHTHYASHVYTDIKHWMYIDITYYMCIYRHYILHVHRTSHPYDHVVNESCLAHMSVDVVRGFGSRTWVRVWYDHVVNESCLAHVSVDVVRGCGSRIWVWVWYDHHIHTHMRELHPRTTSTLICIMIDVHMMTDIHIRMM